MVNSDERIDTIIDGISKLSVAVESLRVRMDSVEDVLNARSESITKVYDYMHTTNERLTKIEACASAQEKLWNRLIPFITILFGVGLSVAGYVVLHVYGGH